MADHEDTPGVNVPYVHQTGTVTPKTLLSDELLGKTLLYIKVQGSTFPTDIALALNIDVATVTDILNRSHGAGYTEDNQGYVHLTYEGLKAANVIEQHRIAMKQIL